MYDRIDRKGISVYFDKGVRENYKYLVIFNDSFEYDYFPELYKDAESVWEANESVKGTWTSIEEVYDLSMDKESQLNEFRARHFPPKPGTRRKSK
jgi:hypothetical protein